MLSPAFISFISGSGSSSFTEDVCAAQCVNLASQRFTLQTMKISEHFAFHSFVLLSSNVFFFFFESRLVCAPRVKEDIRCGFSAQFGGLLHQKRRKLKPKFEVCVKNKHLKSNLPPTRSDWTYCCIAMATCYCYVGKANAHL